jgi:hypothetical protein
LKPPEVEKYRINYAPEEEVPGHPAQPEDDKMREFVRGEHVHGLHKLKHNKQRTK